jgi:hypothetical protein
VGTEEVEDDGILFEDKMEAQIKTPVYQRE